MEDELGDSEKIILPKAKWWLVASLPIHLKQNLTISFFLVLSTQSFKNGKNGAGNITILSKSILDTKSRDLSVSLQTHMVKGKTDPS